MRRRGSGSLNPGRSGPLPGVREVRRQYIPTRPPAGAPPRNPPYSPLKPPQAGSERSEEPDHSGERPKGTPRVRTSPNRHGGMLGGISSGMPIVLRCAVKPTSSIPQDRPTVTRTGEPTTIATKGRHDPCLLPRFIPMAEAMMAIVLADHMLRQRAISGVVAEQLR